MSKDFSSKVRYTGKEGVVSYLSFHDLFKIPKFKDVVLNQDIEGFEDILFENGADISRGWELRESLHRPRTSNQAVHGLMVYFIERLDRDWLVNGSPTLEAKLWTKDYTLRCELLALNPRNLKKEERSVGELMRGE